MTVPKVKKTKTKQEKGLAGMSVWGQVTVILLLKPGICGLWVWGPLQCSLQDLVRVLTEAG